MLFPFVTNEKKKRKKTPPHTLIHINASGVPLEACSKLDRTKFHRLECSTQKVLLGAQGALMGLSTRMSKGWYLQQTSRIINLSRRRSPWTREASVPHLCSKSAAIKPLKETNCNSGRSSSVSASSSQPVYAQPSYTDLYRPWQHQQHPASPPARSLLPSQVALWKGDSTKPCCYISRAMWKYLALCCLLAASTLKIEVVMNPPAVPKGGGYARWKGSAPSQEIPAILWSSPSFLLPLELQSSSTDYFSVQKKVTDQACESDYQEELSNKDLTLLQSQNKARAWRSPQFLSDTSDAGRQAIQAVLHLLNWAACGHLVTPLLSEAGSAWEAFMLSVLRESCQMEVTAGAPKAVWSIRILLCSL